MSKCNRWFVANALVYWSVANYGLSQVGEKRRRSTHALEREGSTAGPRSPLPASQCKAQAWDCPLVSPYVPDHRYKAVYSSSHWVNHIILGSFLFPWTSQCSAWGKVAHTTHSIVLHLILQLRPWRKTTQETFIFLQNWYSTGRACTIMLHLLPFSCYLPLGDLGEAEVT